MQMPSIRSPQILEGPRGSGLGNPDKNFILLVDLVKLKPGEGEMCYFSSSTDLRLLLRGAKKITDSDRRVIGETMPLEVKFEGGFLKVKDDPESEEEDRARAVETNKLLGKHAERGKLFFTYDDIAGMKDTADTRQMETFLSVASPDVIERLKQRLDIKGFGDLSKPKPTGNK
jgi:hypothetical protein